MIVRIHNPHNLRSDVVVDLRKQILQDMGIDVWLLRSNTEAADPVTIDQTATVNDADSNSDTNSDTNADTDAWRALQNRVQSCQLCSLSKSRTQTVFGSGNTQANLLLIGEAPGAEEDRQGLPFVGKSGKLLDAMMFAIGLQRDQVYICNVLKCRPPDNHNPQPAEIECCASYLQMQIELIKPKVILALGRFAAHSLLQTDIPIYKMRESNNTLPDSEIPVVVTCHPASLLRSPEQKAQSWQDLCRVRKLLETVVEA